MTTLTVLTFWIEDLCWSILPDKVESSWSFLGDGTGATSPPQGIKLYLFACSPFHHGLGTEGRACRSLASIADATACPAYRVGISTTTPPECFNQMHFLHDDNLRHTHQRTSNYQQFMRLRHTQLVSSVHARVIQSHPLITHPIHNKTDQSYELRGSLSSRCLYQEAALVERRRCSSQCMHIVLHGNAAH
jgi:hypothetical protein